MKLDERDFQILRLINHFRKNGIACFTEMGGGKFSHYLREMTEYLQEQDITIVDKECMAVSITEKGERILKDHLEEYKNSEKIVPISRSFLQACLEQYEMNHRFGFETVSKSYLENYNNVEDEIFILVSLHGMNCIEIEGIYPDVKLRITEKGARLAQKDIEP